MKEYEDEEENVEITPYTPEKGGHMIDYGQ